MKYTEHIKENNGYCFIICKDVQEPCMFYIQTQRLCAVNNPKKRLEIIKKLEFREKLKFL